MSWTSALTDATAIESIFAGEIPELTGVRVHQVTFKRDGPQAVVHLDLPTYPSVAPAKWRSKEFNTVQLESSFVGARGVTMDGFGRDPVADIEIIHADAL